MEGLTVGTAHGECMEAGVHVCQQPSGRACHDQPCAEPAGTWWGTYWCPAHDKARLDRIAGQFNDLLRGVSRG